MAEVVDLMQDVANAGVRAVPTELAFSEEDGEVVGEGGFPVRVGQGRHAEPTSSRTVEEQAGWARLREAAEDLVDALHERGWVLGLEDGEGLGLRADGSVVLLDMGGLTRSRDRTARHGDQAWLDALPGRCDGMLRRRRGTGGSTVQLTDQAGSVGLAEDADAVAATVLTGSGADRSMQGDRTECESSESDAWDAVVRPVPTQFADAGEQFPRWHRSKRTGKGALRNRRSRLPERSVVVAAVAVLLTVVIVGGGAYALVDRAQRDATQAAGSPTSSTAVPANAAPVLAAEGTEPPPATERTESTEPSEDADPVTDPQAGLEQLLDRRQEYLLGHTEVPVAAADSPAALHDLEVREAYLGLEVVGDSPRIRDAEVLEHDPGSGVLQIRAEVQQPAAQVTGANGEIWNVEAEDWSVLDFELHQLSGRWQLVEVRAAQDTVRADAAER
jgi:hypothetical protein